MNYMTAEKLAASKSVLAKLLASENIDVIHNPGVKTAYFDLKNRTVVCPVWKDMEGYLYDLLLSHEVGHALYTKHDDWFNSIQKESDKPNFKNFVNVIEDVRIEKFMKRKFPGLKRSYILGNKWLIDSGFFGEKAKSPKRINGMSLIDRINMYFRVDGSVSIDFTAEEKVFVNRAERLSTWNDVYQLAKDIYEFEKQNSETNKNDLDEGQDDSGEGSGEGYESFKTDDQADTDGKGDTEADTDGSGSNEGNDTDKGNEGTTTPSNGDGDTDRDNEPKSETDEAFRQNQDNLVNDDYGNDIQNIIIPDIDPDDYVVSFSDLMNTFRKNDVEYLKNYENEAKKNMRNHKDSVDYLVKEFEMKKAADQHKRTKVSKTGVIDPTLLHSYRFNDDIFMRSSTVEEGKNHGLIIYVDWSISMTDIISYALDQVMILVRFCQKVNIPYVVYAFNNGNSMVKKNKVKNQKTNELIMNNFALVELISSDLKKSDNKKAFNLLQALKTNKGTYGNLRLNATPLDQAVATMGSLYRRFKNKYNVDVLNTVFVTDGGSNRSSTKDGGFIYPSTKDNPYYITDAYTKKTSVYTDTGLTMAMVDKLKQIYNMNVMNFHLVNDPEIVSQMFRIFNVNNVKVSDVKSDGYTTGNSTVGFDDVYVVWPNKAKKWSDDKDVKTRTKNRKKKRLMLNQFTEKIS